jgi:hypothetical protein
MDGPAGEFSLLDSVDNFRAFTDAVTTGIASGQAGLPVTGFNSNPPVLDFDATDRTQQVKVRNLAQCLDGHVTFNLELASLDGHTTGFSSFPFEFCPDKTNPTEAPVPRAEFQRLRIPDKLNTIMPGKLRFKCICGHFLPCPQVG